MVGRGVGQAERLESAARLHPVTAKALGFDYFAARWPDAPGRQILAVLGGSHAQGLATPQSDVDLRGVFLAQSRLFLGIDGPPRQFHHRESDTEFLEVAYLFEQLAAGTPNAFELLLTPEALAEAPEAARLREAATSMLSLRLYPQLRGFAQMQLARFEKTLASGAADFKAACRALRMLEVTRELLATGRYSVALDEARRLFLLAVKRGEVAPAEIRSRYGALDEAVGAARVRTALRAEPDLASAHALLVELRLADLGLAGAIDRPELPPVRVGAEEVYLAPTTRALGLPQPAEAERERGRIEVRDFLRLTLRGSPDRLVALFRKEEALRRSELGRFLLAQRQHLLGAPLQAAFAGEATKQRYILSGVKRPKPGEPPFDLGLAARRYLDALGCGRSLLLFGDLREAPEPASATPADALAAGAEAEAALAAAAGKTVLPPRARAAAVDQALCALRLSRLDHRQQAPAAPIRAAAP